MIARFAIKGNILDPRAQKSHFVVIFTIIGIILHLSFVQSFKITRKESYTNFAAVGLCRMEMHTSTRLDIMCSAQITCLSFALH